MVKLCEQLYSQFCKSCYRSKKSEQPLTLPYCVHYAGILLSCLILLGLMELNQLHVKVPGLGGGGGNQCKLIEQPLYVS